MKILVTGGAGFIGQNFIEKLDGEVYALDLKPFPDTYSEEYFPVSGKLLDLIRHGRYFTDAHICFRHRYDIIIHLAADSSTNATTDSVSKNNIAFTKRIIDKCISEDSFLVFASSAGVYGNSDAFLEETDLDMLEPISKYGLSKLFSEAQIAMSGIPALIIRPFNIFGRYESHKCVSNMCSPVTRVLCDILEHKSTVCRIFPDYLPTRDFYFAGDLVDTVIRLLKKNIRGTYNLGSGTGISFEDIIRKSCEAFGGEYYFADFPLPDDYQVHTKADISRILDTGCYVNTDIDKAILMTKPPYTQG